MALYKLLLPLLCLGFILGFASCASTATCDTQISTDLQPILLFQKTPCYGSCPAYNATFYADGSIKYEGIRHTPVKGELKLCLSAKQHKEIQSLLKALDVASMESQYLSSFTDLPSTYLTFYEQGKSLKRIKHQQGGPEKLQELISLLDSTVTKLVQAQKQDN